MQAPTTAPQESARSRPAGPMAVPTIDLSRLDGSATERAALAEEVRACCHEGCGFFYLVGHGVEPELFSAVFALSRAAFALPAAEKAKIDKRASPFFRGYEAAGSERTQGRPDHREQIDTWTECAVAPPGSPPGYERLLGPNQFFDDGVLPGYKRTTLEWHRRCSAVAARLLEALSLALGLPPDAIDGRFGASERRQSLIKYIRYPPTPAGGQGVGLHQDSAYLTLLAPGDAAGLECQLPGGEMLPVGAKEGTFVVNLGEALQLMTGNYFVATPHRVSAPRASPRTAVTSQPRTAAAARRELSAQQEHTALPSRHLCSRPHPLSHSVRARAPLDRLLLRAVARGGPEPAPPARGARGRRAGLRAPPHLRHHADARRDRRRRRRLARRRRAAQDVRRSAVGLLLARVPGEHGEVAPQRMRARAS